MRRIALALLTATVASATAADLPKPLMKDFIGVCGHTVQFKPELYGPSIVPYISKYQDGRGKPKSGPLDGAGRRSIYTQVRRNFLTPMFLAFDYPLPISTIGARGTSTEPRA